MRRPTVSLFIFTLSLSLLAFVFPGGHAAQAQTYTVLHRFTGGEDGGVPYAGLTPDGSGSFYGTTAGKGQGVGTVFRLKQTEGNWVLQTIASGLDYPLGRVVFGPQGRLYGTTYGPNCGFGGSCGGVYGLQRSCSNENCPWTMTVLYQFECQLCSDGAQPFFVDPVFDQAGNLYGTTLGGGSLQGNVFKLTPPSDGSMGQWTETVLYNFTGGNDGGLPASGVILDTAGNLYGTTQYGGSFGNGTVYKLSPAGSSWVLSTLHSFSGGDDGQFPLSALISDSSGSLYGTTAGAGAAGGGTVFRLSPSGGSWIFSVLYSLPGANGGPVGSLTMDAAGNFYGTTVNDGTHGYGSVFELMPLNGDWIYSDLYDFSYLRYVVSSNGYEPTGAVALDASGHLYGTTPRGGLCPFGCGVIWEITR